MHPDNAIERMSSFANKAFLFKFKRPFVFTSFYVAVGAEGDSSAPGSLPGRKEEWGTPFGKVSPSRYNPLRYDLHYLDFVHVGSFILARRVADEVQPKPYVR